MCHEIHLIAWVLVDEEFLYRKEQNNISDECFLKQIYDHMDKRFPLV